MAVLSWAEWRRGSLLLAFEQFPFSKCQASRKHCGASRASLDCTSYLLTQWQQWHGVRREVGSRHYFSFLWKRAAKEGWSVLGTLPLPQTRGQENGKRTGISGWWHPEVRVAHEVLLPEQMWWFHWDHCRESTSVKLVHLVVSKSVRPSTRIILAVDICFFFFYPTKPSDSYLKLCKGSLRQALWNKFLFSVSSPCPSAVPIVQQGITVQTRQPLFHSTKKFSNLWGCVTLPVKHWMAIALRVNTNSRHQIKLPDSVWCSSVTSWHFWCEYRGFCRKFISCSSWRIIFTYLSIYICQQQASFKWLQWLVYRLHYF